MNDFCASIHPISTRVLRAGRSGEETRCQGVLDPLTDLLAGTVATRTTVGSLSFREVSDEEDWRQVRRFRREQYERLLPYMLRELDESGADELDGRSCVFGAWWEGSVVATIRLTGYPYESLRYLPEARLEAFLGAGFRDDYLEWSRLLVDPTAPVRRIMPAILTYAGVRTLTATPYRGYFGYATTLVRQVFSRFDLEIDAEPFTIPNRGDHSYVLLKGDFMRDFQRLVGAWKAGAGFGAMALRPGPKPEEAAAAADPKPAR